MKTNVKKINSGKKMKYILKKLQTPFSLLFFNIVNVFFWDRSITLHKVCSRCILSTDSSFTMSGPKSATSFPSGSSAA